MIYLLKCWDWQKDIWKVWLSWENRCTECIGCFDWFWHCKLELLWGKLGPNSTIVENFGEGSRKRVCLRLCVCGGSVPLPFWLEFFSVHEWFSGTQTIFYQRHLMGLGFLLLQGLIITPSMTALLSLENGMEYRMGEPTAREPGSTSAMERLQGRVHG